LKKIVVIYSLHMHIWKEVIYRKNVFMQIYVVDSLDRERIGKAKAEFQVVYSERYNNLNTILWVIDSQLTY
jgi:hypothetical protein